MRTKLFLFIFLFIFLSKNNYSQSFSNFSSLFLDLPKDGLLIKYDINYQNYKVIDKKFGSILPEINVQFNTLYALYKFEIDKNYIAFILGLYGIMESGASHIYLKIYDLKNEKFLKNKNYTKEDKRIALVRSTGDAGYSIHSSSIISDFNNDGYYDILIFDFTNDNGNRTYSTLFKIWENNDFVKRPLK